MIMRQYDVDGIFQKLICCNSNLGNLDCKENIPADAKFLIGMYPARYNELIKCCNFENLLDKTESDKK